jgi:hypothetical protein
MALPALEKTWEFRTNVAFVGTSNLNSHQVAFFTIKNLLTDTIANGYQDGSFVDIGGGSFEIQGITDDVLDVSMVGKTIKVRGSTSVGNDGDFVITAVPTADSVRYTNGSGVAEAVNGSWNVLGGNFTNPWVMQHSQVQGTVGVRDDGVDRFGLATDVGDVDPTVFSYWVLRNPVTESEWALILENNIDSPDERSYMRFTASPNFFNEGPGGADSRPDGNTVVNVDGSRFSHFQSGTASDPWFWGDQGGQVGKIHVAMSDDGEHTRLFATGEGALFMFWMDETVKNPHPDWISSGNSTVTSMVTGTGSISSRVTYAVYNDNANAIGSTIPATGVSNSYDHHSPDLFLSAEGYGAAMNGENLAVANELTGEWPLYPIGVVSTELGHRARLGQLKDIWWTSTGLEPGQTMPDDTTRQFLVVGDMVIPWDGSLPEMS